MTAGVGATVIALAALLAVVLWWARRPTEAVRLRNALRLQPSHEGDFTWVPPHFRRASPSSVERQAANGQRSSPRSALKRFGRLPGAGARWPPTERAGPGPVRADPMTTHRAIGPARTRRLCEGLPGPRARCEVGRATMGILVRRFGGGGATVVELYDRERKRWLLLDVFNNSTLSMRQVATAGCARVSRRPARTAGTALMRPTVRSTRFRPRAQGAGILPARHSRVVSDVGECGVLVLFASGSAMVGPDLALARTSCRQRRGRPAAHPYLRDTRECRIGSTHVRVAPTPAMDHVCRGGAPRRARRPVAGGWHSG